MTRLSPSRSGLRPDAPPYFLGYLLLQALVVVGLTTTRFTDSISYLYLSFTGSEVRLPTVPLLYWLLPTDPLRVAGQTLLAAVAWWVLATSAGRMIHDRRVRIALIAVLLTLGLVAPIASWNSVILSESTALSLTALVIAAWLRYVQHRSWGTALGVIVATLFWTFTRQPDVLFGVMFTLAACVAAVVSRGKSRVPAVLAVALVLISTAGFFELQRNQTLSKNTLLYMLKNRIIPNHDRTAWFVSHGMPAPRFDPRQVGRAAARNPAFLRWLDAHGERTYIRFVATHPSYTLLGPLPYLVGEQASLHHPNQTPFPEFQPNPTPAIFSPAVNYGRHRDVVPTVVQELLFEQGRIGSLLLLAIGGVGLAWVGWRKLGPDRRYLVPGLVTASAIPQAYIVWLSGGEATYELDRLSMVTAVSLRIGLWLILAIAVDRYVSIRAERAPSS